MSSSVAVKSLKPMLKAFKIGSSESSVSVKKEGAPVSSVILFSPHNALVALVVS